MTLNVGVAGMRRLFSKNDGGNRNGDGDSELPVFDFETLANATNGFSTNSKLGEGGFGSVYKVITMPVQLKSHKNLGSSHVQMARD